MIELVEYSDFYFDMWNRFVDESDNGTLFHRMDFLRYHGEKFKKNERHLIWLKGEAIIAVMPLAIFENNCHKVVKSPYGASFGGLIHNSKFTLKEALVIFDLFSDYLKKSQPDEVSITLPPSCYSRSGTQYFQYLLSKNGYRLKSRDVFNVIPLKKSFEGVWNENLQGRARTAIKKAKPGFDICLDMSPDEFFPILLEDKHRHGGSKPTHTLEELKWLKDTFPNDIFFDIATLRSNGAKAGICYFKCNSRVLMTFYMAQENEAVGANGTNVLLEEGLKRAVNLGMDFFDFGGSSIGYEIENIGVANFKEGFGSKAYLRDSYYINSL